MKKDSKIVFLSLTASALLTLLHPVWIPIATIVLAVTSAQEAASSLGDEVQLSGPVGGTWEDWNYPAVAYNTLRSSHIMFAHSHSSAGGVIYGYYWSEIPDDSIRFLALCDVQPAVAYNRTNDDFLLVAMWDSDLDGRYEIWGIIIQGDASTEGTPFLIFQWPNRSFWSPRVVWNSSRNEYLVLWNAINTTTGFPNDLSAARVSATGTVLPGAPHVITEGGKPHQADVVYNSATDEYLMVWRKEGVGTQWDIWAIRLRGSDLGAATTPFSVNSSPEDQAAPVVATNEQNRYVVLWEHAYPGPCCDWDIRAQEMDQFGTLAGDVRVVAQTSDDEKHPRVVARPDLNRDFMMVWQRETDSGSQIWASRWEDNSIPSEYFQVRAAAGWDYTSPAIMVTGSNAFIAYEGDSQSDPAQFRHIYGRQWLQKGDAGVNLPWLFLLVE